MDPTWVVVRNAFHRITKKKKNKEWGCLYANLVKRTYRSVLKMCVCGFRWNNNHIQRNPHNSELHAWPGLQDGRRPERVFRLPHRAVTLIMSCSRFTDVFACFFFFGVFSVFVLFSLKVCVNTKSQSSLEYCSAAIYRIAKTNNLTDLHTTSHIVPCLFLVVLFKKEHTTKCKHDKKKLVCINVNRSVPVPALPHNLICELNDNLMSVLFWILGSVIGLRVLVQIRWAVIGPS